ncbi:MAG TPA: hypothetical protein PLP17_09070 [Oligoflexia bacterium]|nr:hypothetical protein [Oligoflexia bacterium]
MVTSGPQRSAGLPPCARYWLDRAASELALEQKQVPGQGGLTLGFGGADFG